MAEERRRTGGDWPTSVNARFWWEWTWASAPVVAVPACRRAHALSPVRTLPPTSPTSPTFDGSLYAPPLSACPAAGSPGLDAEESLAEFRELVASAGGVVAAELLQRRARPDPATLVGSGKVEEIAGVAASTEADLVLFDHDLSPTQLRNLEAALPCRVLDRTQLILDIFARHARTREGQLQVELAQLEYMLPRLTGRGKSMSQLGGGIGTRGPGETQLETDRRRIQRRIDQLKLDLEAVRRVRSQQRQRRESVPVPTVALVGYTNAGKSTLFNRLTGAQVLQSSRMFATLDPKLRAIELPSRRKVLLSDTVGFIRNLPHTLVTSFRATLEEVAQAEVLLHVRDAASTYGDEQKDQVEKVLGELDSLGKPRIEVLNKIDLLGRTSAEASQSRCRSGRESRGLRRKPARAWTRCFPPSTRRCTPIPSSRRSCACRSRKALCWRPLKPAWWSTGAPTRATWCASK